MANSFASLNPQLIVSFGEMLIDFVPDVAGASLAESSAFLKAPGGAPANVACAIKKLGGNSAFIGKFGDDEFGHMLVDVLKKHGVNTDGICFDPHARTALAFVTLKKNGEREFTFYRNPSADMLLKESDLKISMIKQAKIFHYGLPLWPSPQAARDGILSIWNYADFIKVSDDEVAFLTQGDPGREDVVLSLWHQNLKLLIVTDGEKGCRYFTKHFKGKVDGFSVKTVDTTGAGDAFVGSILVSLAMDTKFFHDEGRLREALLFANACGAICVTRKGAIPALPTRSDALGLIKSKGMPLLTKTCMLFSSLAALVSILVFLLYKAK
ncbi:PfkB-like carbohydrate kinase family protein [Theobroma cacao]|uniref:PfkB-like carbohydrate kinase family protein n=1 Tax=Theobroma cacao TaxID=3641 RepID=A0A061FIC4_THECC|nr:PfkB-like carbohydrate kinase family protein [Theobroma cacao]